MADSLPSDLWTLQQFAQVAGRPWFALQQHNDSGVIFQFTGYLKEIDAVVARLDIVPVPLPVVSSEEFMARHYDEMPSADQLVSALSNDVTQVERPAAKRLHRSNPIRFGF